MDIEWSDGNDVPEEDLPHIRQKKRRGKQLKYKSGEKVRIRYFNKWFLGEVVSVTQRDRKEQSKIETESAEVMAEMEEELSDAKKIDDELKGETVDNMDSVVQMNNNIDRKSPKNNKTSQDLENTPELETDSRLSEDSLDEESFNFFLGEPFSLTEDITEAEISNCFSNVSDLGKDMTQKNHNKHGESQPNEILSSTNIVSPMVFEQGLNNNEVNKIDTLKNITSLVKPCSILLTKLKPNGEDPKTFNEAKSKSNVQKNKSNILSKSKIPLNYSRDIECCELKEESSTLRSSEKLAEKQPRRRILKSFRSTDLPENKDQEINSLNKNSSNENYNNTIVGKVLTPQEQTLQRITNNQLLNSPETIVENKIKPETMHLKKKIPAIKIIRDHRPEVTLTEYVEEKEHKDLSLALFPTNPTDIKGLQKNTSNKKFVKFITKPTLSIKGDTLKPHKSDKLTVSNQIQSYTKELETHIIPLERFRSSLNFRPIEQKQSNTIEVSSLNNKVDEVNLTSLNEFFDKNLKISKQCSMGVLRKCDIHENLSLKSNTGGIPNVTIIPHTKVDLTDTLHQQQVLKTNVKLQPNSNLSTCHSPYKQILLLDKSNNSPTHLSVESVKVDSVPSRLSPYKDNSSTSNLLPKLSNLKSVPELYTQLISGQKSVVQPSIASCLSNSVLSEQVHNSSTAQLTQPLLNKPLTGLLPQCTVVLSDINTVTSSKSSCASIDNKTQALKSNVIKNIGVNENLPLQSSRHNKISNLVIPSQPPIGSVKLPSNSLNVTQDLSAIQSSLYPLKKAMSPKKQTPGSIPDNYLPPGYAIGGADFISVNGSDVSMSQPKSLRADADSLRHRNDTEHNSVKGNNIIHNSVNESHSQVVDIGLQTSVVSTKLNLSKRKHSSHCDKEILSSETPEIQENKNEESPRKRKSNRVKSFNLPLQNELQSLSTSSCNKSKNIESLIKQEIVEKENHNDTSTNREGELVESPVKRNSRVMENPDHRSQSFPVLLPHGEIKHAERVNSNSAVKKEETLETLDSSDHCKVSGSSTTPLSSVRHQEVMPEESRGDQLGKRGNVYSSVSFLEQSKIKTEVLSANSAVSIKEETSNCASNLRNESLDCSELPASSSKCMSKQSCTSKGKIPQRYNKEEDLEVLLDGQTPFIREVFKCENIRNGFNNRDLIFVLSLLPDLQELTETQKVIYKLKAIDILNEVMNDKRYKRVE